MVQMIGVSNKMIPHSKPILDGSEYYALREPLIKGELAAGGCIDDFEQKMRNYLNRAYSISCSSGTSAIELSLRSLDIGKGDEVIIPSYICYSVMAAVENAGAMIVLADSDKQSPNISKETVEPWLTSKTSAIIVPHMFGIPADIEGIMSFGIPVIEDCAQSIGGRVGERVMGSIGDIAVMSFYATKMMACARGGMVATDDRAVADGIKDLMHYDGRDVRGKCFNYSMSNIEAAIGTVQLGKLDSFIKRRKKIATMYDNVLDAQGFGELIVARADHSVNFRYLVRIPEYKDLDDVISKMQTCMVDARKPIYRPLHLYINGNEEKGNPLSMYPNSTEHHRRNISIPIYPSLDDDGAKHVIAMLSDLIR